MINFQTADELIPPMHFSTFRVLVFSSAMGVRRTFSRGTQPWWNIISPTQNLQINIFSHKKNMKISNVKIQESQSPRSSLPTPMSSTKYKNPFLWHVSGSHDISTSFCKAWNAIFLYHGDSKKKQPKIRITDRDMFWKTFWYNLAERNLFSPSFKNLVLQTAKLTTLA